MAETTVKLIDNANAPELYAGAATGFFVNNGMISITLESPRADHTKSPTPITRVVVGRLVMPAAGAHALAVGLSDFLEQQGFNFKK